MAENERELRQIIETQRWMKAALAELLENNAKIIANQATQITQLTAIKSVLDKIEEQTLDEEALEELKGIKQILGWMLDKM